MCYKKLVGTSLFIRKSNLIFVKIINKVKINSLNQVSQKNKIKKRKIYILLFSLLIFCITGYTQNSLKGVVIDNATQTPLAGVSILIKNKEKGVMTDFDGEFNLQVPKGDVLQFSYLGYKTIEYTVDNFSFVTIEMKEDAESLSEIVVIGYGSTKIKDATGSVVSLKEKDLNKGNIVTPENLLQGRVAGLSINTGGGPGSGSVIRIRGGSSLNASNDPLIVIDGLPIDNNAVGGSRSILSTINPNEIESFSVLKDASATAIYGSRASNGVIIITTKRGSSKLKINLNSSTSYHTLSNKIDVFSADEYRTLIAQQRPNLVDRLGNANTDWQEEIYQNTFSSSTNLSVNGAIFKEKIPVRLSVGNSIQNGLRLTSSYERNSVSLSVNPRLFDDKLKLSVNANYSHERNRFASGQEGNALTFDPTQPVHDVDSPFGGYFQHLVNGIGDSNGILNQNDLIPLAPLNPVAELFQRKSISKVHRIYGNVKLDYSLHFLPEMSLIVNLGLDNQKADGSVNVSDLNPLTQNNGRIIGSSLEYKNTQTNFLLDGYFKYKKQFGNVDFDLTTGYSYQKFEKDKYTTNELLDDGADSEPITTIVPNLVLLGYFSRLNLSLKDTYLLTLTYRRDGTSRFSKTNRWGNFPSVAFAWKLKEDLFSEELTISTLKVRLGWGITGQQDIGDGNLDLYLDNYIKGNPSAQYQFGNATIPVGIPDFRNESLKWEETTTYNAGIDVGILEDRFTLSLDVFRKDSSDLLIFAALADGSNFSNAGIQNIGKFTSQGIEFLVQGDILKAETQTQFHLNVSLNSSLILTELTNLQSNQDILTGIAAGGTGVETQIHRVGYTPYSFFVYKQIYDVSGLPIEGTYADLNGDNRINGNDRYIHHNNTPSLSLGFASNMSYRNFDFSFNLRAVLGNYVYNNVNSARSQYSLLENGSVLSNLPTSVLQTNFNTTSNVILSDYFIEDASFLRVDNVSLGYNFKDIFNSKFDVRFSMSVQNLWVITNYTGLDPEVFNNGIDNTIYPRPRTFLINANIQF